MDTPAGLFYIIRSHTSHYFQLSTYDFLSLDQNDNNKKNILSQL